MRPDITKVSVDITALAIIHSAAARLFKINRENVRKKGREPEDSGLEDALIYTLSRLTDSIGIK
jgi:hypothetical protein